MKQGDFLTESEVKIVHEAMRWYERQWPHDPEAQKYPPDPYFPDASGEVLPPTVMLIHHDGWQIGRIETVDGFTQFVRDYKELE